MREGRRGRGELAKLRKMYLAPWTVWFGLAMLVPVWTLVTYLVFFTPEGRQDLGVAGWAVTTVIIGAVAVVLVLLGRRKLPMYLVEEPDESEE